MNKEDVNKVATALYELEDNMYEICELLIGLRQSSSGEDRKRFRRILNKFENAKSHLSEVIDEFDSECM